MSNDYLIHYGVLGMKWGVRKRSDSKSGSNKTSRNKKSNGSRVKTFKSNVKQQLSKIDKQKAKKYAKVALGVAATAAIIATTGNIVNGVMAGQASINAFNQSKSVIAASDRVTNALSNIGNTNINSIDFVDAITKTKLKAKASKSMRYFGGTIYSYV